MADPSVDPDLCIGCELCPEICPEVFEMRDDGLAHVKDGAKCDELDTCNEAAESCPVDAIEL